MQKRNLMGQRFGRLTVIAPAAPASAASNYACKWVCRCDCGGEKTVTGDALVRGLTRSCGCLGREWNVKAIAYARACYRQQLKEKEKEDALRNDTTGPGE